MNANANTRAIVVSDSPRGVFGALAALGARSVLVARLRNGRWAGRARV